VIDCFPFLSKWKDDLLPDMIDMVVIGDRLFSLPIQVEGREGNEEAGVQMELDNGSNERGNGADESSETREPGNNDRKGHDQGGDQVRSCLREVGRRILVDLPKVSRLALKPVLVLEVPAQANRSAGEQRSSC
jgi:hypothetical protein